MLDCKGRIWVLWCATVLCFLAGPTVGIAQDYPTKPITIYLGFPPGGAGGISAQIFADCARRYLPKPQPILLNYKPGAAHAVAADFVLKQPADGYSLYWLLPDLMVKVAKDAKTLSFGFEDLIPIGILGASPCAITVRKDSPYKTLQDFIDDAKKNPGKISYASSGIGSFTHLVAEVFQMRTGTKMNQIPFAGASQVTTAVLGGHVPSWIGGSIAANGAHLKPEGGLRVLTVFAKERWPEFPDVPTCIESGYNIEYSVWYSLAAAKETPKPILDALQQVFKQTADDPQVKENLIQMNYRPMNLGMEEAGKKVKEDFEVAKEVFKKLGMTQ
jgi:tripartite-type tricarboxylate transporter receptor subunit TctC